MQYMDAVAIYPRVRQYHDDGSFIEMVIWHLPAPVPPCTHAYKYRLVYVVDGVRVVGYDNERGKGDHRHVNGVELAYVFSTPQQLLADFRGDVARWMEDVP